jgi:hypothetical protein
LELAHTCDNAEDQQRPAGLSRRDNSDVYILSGAEDLVPVLHPPGARKRLTRTVYGTPYQISFYRPRIEGLFARIERWTATDTGISHWRVASRATT